MTYGRGNHAVRSSRWRYIRYADGSQELYDTKNDSHEWTNLAEDARHERLIAWHRRWIPKQEAKRVADLKVADHR